MSSNKHQKLTPQMENLKNKVQVGRYAVSQSQTISYHGSFGPNYDNSFNMDNFRQDFEIVIKEKTDDKLVFDMIGVDAPVANAFRRVMISEVPTVAIEWISVVKNTSIIQDEVLAHRVGLIPINADPRLFDFPSPSLQRGIDPTKAPRLDRKKENAAVSSNTKDDTKPYPPSSSGYLPIGANLNVEVWDVPEELSDTETLLFRLHVKCENRKVPNKHNYNVEEYENHKVYSDMLKWVPIGDQAERFKDKPIRPVHDDILIAKLNPGQEIHLECYCMKGIGKDHAKFSPVATASYRLLPDITFKVPVVGADAHELKKICPMNVFDIEDGEAVVARPRDCTMCRECIRTDEWENRVQLSRLKYHYIFSIEAVGMLKPEDIFREGLRILYEKCMKHAKAVHQQLDDSDEANTYALK
jgi:DNA-directed RNA polymerase I and III subunit RPAC1